MSQKRTRHLLLFCFMLFINGYAHAQMSMLSGTVKSGDAIVPFAALQLEGIENHGETTDENGAYKFEAVKPGEYTLTISCLGYKTRTQQITLQAGNNTQDITLESDLLNLEQVVVTGTRRAVPVYESPIIVEQISTKTFEATQALSLSEGLNFSPGLRVETNCQNCGFTQLRINGLDGAYSQILINSRPIFSALAGVYGLDMLPANMIDRVEVVKGGGSALYGGNAIGGTVNIITKDPTENTFEVGINQSFIDMEAPDRTVYANGSIVNKDLSKGISLYGYNRNREHWDANGDGYSEMTELNNTTFGFNSFWNISERNKIQLNFNTIAEHRRGGNKFDLAPHQTDITEQLDHRIYGGGLSYEHYSKNYRHKFSVYASGQITHRDSYYGGGGRVLGENDTLTADDIAAINAYGNSDDIAVVGGLQYAFDWRENLVLMLGSEYQYNDVEDNMPGYNRTIDQQVGTLGSYAQLEWDPFKKLCIVLGGRYDYVAIDGAYNFGDEAYDNTQQLGVAVPRLSLMYDLTKAWKVRASYAQGYRAPQAFDEDLHIETVGGAARFIQLDPELETERSNSFTASLNYTQTSGKLQSNIVIEGFYTDLENPFILSDQVELDNGVAMITKRNGDGAVVQGINLEGNFAYTRKLTVQVGVTLQTAKYKTTEMFWEAEDSSDETPATTTDNVLRSPNTYGFWTLIYNPYKTLNLSYSGVYTGSMDVAHVIDPDTEYTTITSTSDFWEHNLKVDYTFELQKDFHLKLFVGMQNILNSYQADFDTGADRDAGYIYGPTRPRTAYAGLSFGF